MSRSEQGSGYMAKAADVLPDMPDYNETSHPEPKNKSKWGFDLYNGRNQVYISAFIAFACPGLFNSLSGLGGAGSQDPRAASMANFALYSCFALIGYTGGMFFNRFGVKLMGLGGFFYAFYALASYLSGNGEAWSEGLFIFAAAALGVAAGMFWTAQGAIMMTYSPPAKRAQYIKIFWVIFNLGGAMGGFLMFFININDKGTVPGKASAASYMTFVGLMVLGSVAGLLLLVNPNKVTREDGEAVNVPKCKSLGEELSDVSKVILDWNMLRLFALFLSSNWFYTYCFNSVTGTLFNLRTRGLMSAFFWLFQMLGSAMFEKIVDGKESRSDFSRGKAGYMFVLVSVSVAWALGIYLQYGYMGGYNTGLNIDFGKDVLDIAEVEAIFPMIVVILYGIADSAVQVFSYWLMSTIARNDAVLNARYTGYYKGVQSAGAAVAWLIDSSYIGLSARGQLWICVALFYFAMIPASFVVRDLAFPDALDTVDSARKRESEMEIPEHEPETGVAKV